MSIRGSSRYLLRECGIVKLLVIATLGQRPRGALLPTDTLQRSFNIMPAVSPFWIPHPVVQVCHLTFAGPHGLAFDSNGNLYVGDTRNNQVKKCRPVDGSIGESE